MLKRTTNRRAWKRTAMVFCAGLLAAPLFFATALAQVSSYGDKTAGENVGDCMTDQFADTLDPVTRAVGFGGGMGHRLTSRVARTILIVRATEPQ